MMMMTTNTDNYDGDGDKTIKRGAAEAFGPQLVYLLFMLLSAPELHALLGFFSSSTFSSAWRQLIKLGTKWIAVVTRQVCRQKGRKRERNVVSWKEKWKCIRVTETNCRACEVDRRRRRRCRRRGANKRRAPRKRTTNWTDVEQDRRRTEHLGNGHSAIHQREQEEELPMIYWGDNLILIGD